MSKAQTHLNDPVQFCPECGGRISSSQDMTEDVCSDCGLVIDENPIDPGPEWRIHNGEDVGQKARTGLPESVSFEHPGTRISSRDTDGHNRKLTHRQLRRARRLRQTDQQSKKSSSERRLIYALCEIRRMCSALGLPDRIRDVACVIYRRSADENLVHGRSIEGIASAAICLATRQESVPRTYGEVATVSRVEQEPIEKYSLVLSRELGLEIEPTTPIEYFAQFCSEMGVASAVQQRARDALEIAVGENAHIGKNPAGFAAGAIYAASDALGGDLLQKDAAEIADVSADLPTNARTARRSPRNGATSTRPSSPCSKKPSRGSRTSTSSSTSRREVSDRRAT